MRWARWIAFVGGSAGLLASSSSVLFGLGGLWACSSGSSASMSASGDAGSVASFAAIYADVLNPVCAPCHSTGSDARATGLLMDNAALAYANLVGDGGGVPAGSGSSCSGFGLRVDPGHAQMSLLIEKLTENSTTTPPLPCGSQMPLDETPLPSSEIEEIEAWINEGAPNN